MRLRIPRLTRLGRGAWAALLAPTLGCTGRALGNFDNGMSGFGDGLVTAIVIMFAVVAGAIGFALALLLVNYRRPTRASRVVGVVFGLALVALGLCLLPNAIERMAYHGGKDLLVPFVPVFLGGLNLAAAATAKPRPKRRPDARA